MHDGNEEVITTLMQIHSPQMRDELKNVSFFAFVSAKSRTLRIGTVKMKKPGQS
jgi:hypothetical protein